MYHLHLTDEIQSTVNGQPFVLPAVDYNTLYQLQNGTYHSRGMLARALYLEGRYVPVASAYLPATERGRDILFRMTSPSPGIPAWSAKPVLALTIHSPYGHFARPSGVGDIVEAIDITERVRGRWVCDYPSGWLAIEARHHEHIPPLLERS